MIVWLLLSHLFLYCMSKLSTYDFERVSVVYQDVTRFEVAMDDVLAVHVL